MTDYFIPQLFGDCQSYATFQPAAETYLRECLTIREKKLPGLGVALVGQKNPGAPGKFPPAAKTRLSEAIRRMVDLYTASDKPEEAEVWRKKLEEAKNESPEANK